MRKIVKECLFSTDYKEWEEKLEQEKKDHPKYTSSNHRFYNDIRMQLYHCQNGMCAFTEQSLCQKKFYDPTNWIDGKYAKKEDLNPGDAKGELDHFNPKLKPKKGWLWDNFFMVDTDVNRKAKSTNLIYHKLKPDLPHYDPNNFFEYDFEEHVIIPKRTLPDSEQKIIFENINFLGLNTISHLREQYIMSSLFQVHIGGKALEDLKISQYETTLNWFNDYIESERKDFTNLMGTTS